MANPRLEQVKALAATRLKRLVDRNGDGKIDLADAEAIAHDAAEDAASYARGNPLTAIVVAFAIGVVLTLFIVSIVR